MALKTKSIRGTRDVVPADVYKWQYVERAALEVAETCGIKEIRVPTIEKTELFVRSVGETTDVVQKEMYTFDKGRESITLRPEGTAGAVRAVLENNLLNDALPLKLCYIMSCFRHENPQAGRLREFHQFGIEMFGSGEPSADAELISVGNDVLTRLGIKNVSLEINSIGCPECRPKYNEKLKEYYKSHYDELCGICKERLERNPLRLLDCKEEGCAALAKDAPKTVDCLCEECGSHFEGLQKYLDVIGIRYKINPKIVRGLDYYTKTVFEFISGDIGAQATVCGGGRYDGLVEQMGGAHMPALGFAMGLERLIMVMDAQGCEYPPQKTCDIYIGSTGQEESLTAVGLATRLRREGFQVETDTMGRSVKSQMKYADKIAAKFSCIIGSNEIEQGIVKVKDMQTGQSQDCGLTAEALAEFLYANCG